MYKKWLTLIAGAVFFVNVAIASSDYGPIVRGDTLWGIAKNHRPNTSITIPQMIQAIAKLNPTINVHQLKVGNHLQLPVSQKEVNQLLGIAAPVAVPAAASVQQKTAAPAQASKQTTASHSVVSLRSKVQESQSHLASVKAQLDQAHKTIAQLHQQTTSGTSSGSWSWLWFAAFLLMLGMYLRKKGLSFQSSSIEIAAARFGLKKKGSNAKNERFQEPMQQFPVDDAGLIVTKKRGEDSDQVDFDQEIAQLFAEKNFPQAEKKLKMAIWEHKENIPYRMKLLELYAQTDNKHEFNKISEYMLKHLISEESDYWTQVRGLYLEQWVYDN